MIPPRRRPPALLLAALVAASCGTGPVLTPAPSGAADGSPATVVVAPERPFNAEAWPAARSACGLPGYAGRLGRIEAVGPRTVRFTLCSPDGAFLARLAHPSLGVIDAAWVDVIAADPGASRTVPGAGPLRVEAWSTGEEVRLARVASQAGASPGATRPASPAAPSPGAPGSLAPAAGPPPVIVLRWTASSAERTSALLDASVDGIDAPAPGDAATMATLPELEVLPRPGLATAYLGFGSGKTFSRVAVRRAFAQAVDTSALARGVFPAGSVPATHVTPCDVPAGCTGADWYAFNGPAASAALDDAGFDRTATITLHVPDAPTPGLPDPAALGAAVRDGLAQSIGVTVALDVMPAAALAAAAAEGGLDGLYLGGVASSLADPSGFLEPLFGPTATGTAATRAKGVREALANAALATGAADRADAFTRVNDAVRSTAAIVPLVHPGSTVAYRADVTAVAISPMGTDPLGGFVPGDRHQLVVVAPSEPAGAWCAISPAPANGRLCALVTPGLYAFSGATLQPIPSLATRCSPSDGATTWTCRLRADLAFTDGRRVDADDVLASLRAQADAGSALRATLPATAFAAWDELFGGPVPAGTP